MKSNKSTNINVKVRNRLKKALNKANQLDLIKSHVLAYEQVPVEKEVHKGNILFYKK